MESDINFDSIESILFEDLEKGDQIAVKGEMRRLHPIYRLLEHIVGEHYWHHGIYIGDYKVIDLGGNDKKSSKPRKIDLLEFMDGSCDKKLYRINYREGACLPVEETVRMAKDVVANGS